MARSTQHQRFSFPGFASRSRARQREIRAKLTRAKCATAIWTRSSGCSRCWPATKSGAMTYAATTEPTRRCYWMRTICIKQRQIKNQGKAA